MHIVLNEGGGVDGSQAVWICDFMHDANYKRSSSVHEHFSTKTTKVNFKKLPLHKSPKATLIQV